MEPTAYYLLLISFKFEVFRFQVVGFVGYCVVEVGLLV